MDALITNVNTTAMVIGYPVIAVIVFLILWFGSKIFRDITKIFDEMRYERWRRRNAEREWSNIEASWMLELDEDYDEDDGLVRYFNHDTDVLPDIQEQLANLDTDVVPVIPTQRHDTRHISQLYNFQEDTHERS